MLPYLHTHTSVSKVETLKIHYSSVGKYRYRFVPSVESASAILLCHGCDSAYLPQIFALGKVNRNTPSTVVLVEVEGYRLHAAVFQYIRIFAHCKHVRKLWSSSVAATTVK